MKDLILDGSFASVSPVNRAHPGLRTGRIIYCDDQPNSNGYGIEYEDFEDIKNTVIGTPIKMKFLGTTLGGHLGSIPIGHVSNIAEAEVDGVHQLIIDTVLYADDYPAEVEWLDEQLKKAQEDPSKKAPGVSFEITYKDTVVKNGVSWIKDLVARAATFVKSPAYGDRTALLALASNTDISAEDFMTELTALAKNNISPKNTDKGGNNRMEEELKRLQAELEAAKAALDAKVAELAAKETEITTLNTSLAEKDTLLAEKDTKLASYQEKEVLSTRQTALAEAGIKVEIKPERLVKMSDEDFTDYVEDLKAVAAAAVPIKDDKKLLASHRGTTPMPKLGATDDTPVSVSELAGRLRDASRNKTEDTE